MKKTIILIIVLILIMTGILYLNFIRQNFTGAVVADNYSYTKAICNETNYCQDYQIDCNGEDMINISPVTGAIIQYASDWKDPRDEEMIDKLCN